MKSSPNPSQPALWKPRNAEPTAAAISPSEPMNSARVVAKTGI